MLTPFQLPSFSYGFPSFEETERNGHEGGEARLHALDQVGHRRLYFRELEFDLSERGLVFFPCPFELRPTIPRITLRKVTIPADKP